MKINSPYRDIDSNIAIRGCILLSESRSSLQSTWILDNLKDHI